MMQKEKILKKSALVAVAAASLIAAPTVAKAADGNTETGKTEATGKLSEAGLSAVSVDASNGVLTATASGSAKEILVGTGKAKIGKGGSAGTITVSNWDIYEPENNTVNVDLSKLKNTVDNYLVLQTNQSEGKVAIVKIPVKAKYIKVKYDAGEAALLASYGESSKNASSVEVKSEATSDGKAGEAAELQYRTVYSSEWADMQEVMPGLKLYQENGAQLYIRLKAGEGENNNSLPAEPNGKEKLTYNNNQTAIGVYEAPSLPGKEVKVTIPAKAKGPTISADFTNGTVKIPKKTEYRLLEGNNFIGELDTPAESDGCKYYYRAATDGKAQSIDSVFTAAAGGTGTVAQAGTTEGRKAVLEIRKAATAKKAASKWSRLEIETLEDMGGYVTVGDTRSIDAIKTEKKQAETGGTEYKGRGIIESKVFEDKDKTGEGIFAIDYLPPKKDGSYDSIQITNKSVNDYEIYVDAAGTGDPNTATGTIRKTKVSGKGTRENKVTKITKLTDLSQIWIRRAGNKKNKTWATNWTKLGVIDYDIPAKTPDTGGN